MNVLQVNTSDCEGGADRIAYDLYTSLKDRGHGSWLSVHRKRTEDPGVLPIPATRDRTPWAGPCLNLAAAVNRSSLPGGWRLARALYICAGGRKQLERSLGHEVFDWKGTEHIPTLAPSRPDLVHAHNLHGNYFDLRKLPALSQAFPFVLTLHDEWMLTGHCAYSMGCERWKQACGECPDLTIPPALETDGTAFNRERKREIYKASRLFVATPSRWLLNRVEASMLHPAGLRHIPYGIDLNIFNPDGRGTARSELDLPESALLLLFVSNLRSPFKDFPTIREALTRIPATTHDGRPVVLLSLGGAARSEEMLEGKRLVHLPFEENPSKVARYYQAADLFLFATRADNFPLVNLEAAGCGTPVIATAVGGVPEQVRGWRAAEAGLPEQNTHTTDTATGVLVPQADAEAMGRVVTELISRPDLLRQMGDNGADMVRKQYDLEHMVDAYEEWYREILASC